MLLCLEPMRGKLLQRVGIDPEHPWVLAAQRARRAIFATDGRLRDDYLRSAEVAKLHIGGGPRLLPGWLNADIAIVPGVVRMDATQPFPFQDAAFEYCYTEHMIEHVSYEGGERMLRECRRVLRDGGVLRVTTPDLAALVALCGEKLSELQEQYLAWFCRECLPAGRPVTPANVFDGMFRLWGHTFIYDEATLTDSLRRAGFRDIQRCRLLESVHPHLRNLENIERYPEGFLELESFVLEARK